MCGHLESQLGKWEIYAYGEAPYKVIMQLDQQFIDSVKMGMRLQKPNGASDEM